MKMNKLRNLLLVLSLVTLTATAQEVRDYELEVPSSEEMDAVMKNTDEPANEATEFLESEYLQEDPNCQQLDTDPEFDDEVYIERLRSLPMEVELPYNKIVRSYIDRYTKRSRTQVRRLLGAMNFYTPIFERELDKAGAPLELKYLPVIESALKPEATSPVGAAGLWQFMASTGKQYKLRIDSRVDERRDIVKSSVAAARLLMDLYRKYNDWALVLAAYNCGPGNVNKAMSRAGGKRDFWAIYNYLPKETRGYVPAFIAATYVMNFYCEHGICPLEAKYPPKVDTVHVVRDLSMRQVSELLGIGLPELKALNPQYKTDIIPGYSGNCVLVLPESLAPEFASYGSDIYKHRASELLQRRATVEVGGGRGNYNESEDNRNITASASQTRTEQPIENTGRRTRSTFRNHRQDNEERTEARTSAPASNPRQDHARQALDVSDAGVRTINRSIRDGGENVTVSERDEENNSRTTLTDDASIKPVETNTTRRNTNAKADPNRGYTSSSRYESNSSNRTNYSNNSRYSNRQSTSNNTSRNVAPTSSSQASNVRTTTTETGARIRRDRTSSATTATKKEEKPAATPKTTTRSAAPKAAEQPRTVSTTKPTISTTPKQETRSSRWTNTNKRNTSTKTEAPKQSTSKKPETTKKEEPSKKAETTTTKPTPRQTATSKRTATNKAATPNNKTTATNKQTATKQPTKTTTKTETKTTSKPDVNNNTNNKKANNKTTAKSQPSATSKPTTNSKAATKTAAKREASTGKQATTKAENKRQTATTKPASTNKPTSKPATTSKPTTLAKSASVKPAVKKGGTNVGKSSGKSGSSK